MTSARQPGSDVRVAPPGKRFHGWRLLGFICAGLLVMAAISFAIDLAVIGPLDGRL
jgi:hypothetical protein